MENNDIFVQIASYRDPELIPTLKDITTQAKRPQELFITVCWQHGEDETVEDFIEAGIDMLGFHTYPHVNPDGELTKFDIINATLNGATVQFIDVPFQETWGACWARNLIQTQYSGQAYTLQLDSHHRFIENWDMELIHMLESLRKESPKPILTGYIPSYDPENDPEGRVMVPWQTNFDRFIPEGAVFFLPSAIKNWEELDKPLKARFYSGHFAFADGTFAEEVKHDPHYFFHGEEISIAVRAYTHGYDLYTPHRIIAWHEYTRKGRVKVWNDHNPQKEKENKDRFNWVKRNELCHKRNRVLFGMDGEDPKSIDFGGYGFGSERTLRDYEKYAGINFKLRGVQQWTLDNNQPPNPYTFTNEEEWLNSFHTSIDVRICVHKSQFPDLPDDIDFCFVGLHDENKNEKHRKDLTGEQFNEYIKEGWINYPYKCILDKFPHSYTVWPHSASKGWLNKIVKEIPKPPKSI